MQTISINFQVPQGWHELDDKQLRYVYSLIAREFSADEIKTLALLHFSGCKVIARHDKKTFLLKHGKNVFQTSGTLIAEVIPSLGWLDAIPASPVRLKKLRNHASVDAEFLQACRLKRISWWKTSIKVFSPRKKMLCSTTSHTFFIPVVRQPSRPKNASASFIGWHR